MTALEMHPTRWGDPARAHALPETARGMVELVFPVSDRRVDEEAVAPGRALAWPEPAGGMVELVSPVSARGVEGGAGASLPESPFPADVLAAFALVVGDDHVLTDDETRRLRTRGKSTPDLLRARA